MKFFQVKILKVIKKTTSEKAQPFWFALLTIQTQFWKFGCICTLFHCLRSELFKNFKTFLSDIFVKSYIFNWKKGPAQKVLQSDETLLSWENG